MTKTSYLEFRKIYCLSIAQHGGLADLLVSECGQRIGAEISNDPNSVLPHLRRIAESNAVKWNWPGELPIKFRDASKDDATLAREMFITPEYVALPWPLPLSNTHMTSRDVTGKDTEEKLLRIAGMVTKTDVVSPTAPQTIHFLRGLGSFLGDDDGDGAHTCFKAIEDTSINGKDGLKAFVKDPQAKARELAPLLPNNIKVAIDENVTEDIRLQFDKNEKQWTIWIPRYFQPKKGGQPIRIAWNFDGEDYPYDTSPSPNKAMMEVQSMMQCSANCKGFWIENVGK